MKEDTLDKIIERTLSEDAERMRPSFATVPNARLTTKLALTTASRGLLGSLGAKLALYTGGALVVGAAVYLLPNAGNPPAKTAVPSVTPKNSAVVHIQNSVSTVSGISTPAPVVKPLVKEPKKPLQLDEGDGKNVKIITDKNYEPPLK